MLFKSSASIVLILSMAQSGVSAVIPSVANCSVGSGMSSPSSPCLTCSSDSFSLGGFNAACVPCGTGVSQCNGKTGIISTCVNTYTLKSGICIAIAVIAVKPLGAPKFIPTQ